MEGVLLVQNTDSWRAMFFRGTEKWNSSYPQWRCRWFNKDINPHTFRSMHMRLDVNGGLSILLIKLRVCMHRWGSEINILLNVWSSIAVPCVCFNLGVYNVFLRIFYVLKLKYSLRPIILFAKYGCIYY
jgi:hypothetical protein